MRRLASLAGVTLALLTALPITAAAQAISFTLLPRYSYATFKTDAPLETVVGHTADAGLPGELSVDPATPQAARGTVKVDMNTVRTGIDKRDADMRAKAYLDTVVKQRAVERVADGTVTYVKLSPEQVEAQKRFGFTSDNIKVRTKLGTTFTDHGMQIPQLLILELSNDIAIETDLIFIRQ